MICTQVLVRGHAYFHHPASAVLAFIPRTQLISVRRFEFGCMSVFCANVYAQKGFPLRTMQVNTVIA